MFRLRTSRKRQDRLADRLPWAAFVNDGVVEQKTGALQKTVEFRGPDLESSTKQGLVSYSARLNNALKRLGSGWAIYVEAQRSRCAEYPDAEWPCAVAEAVDVERRQQFRRASEKYDSRYFLTLVYEPPKRSKSSLLGFLFEGGEEEEEDGRETRLRHFEERVRSVVSLLRDAFPYVEELDAEQTATYLHSTVSTKSHPVKLPEVPVYLDALLADETLDAGLELKLGGRFLQTVTVRSFPSATVPAILDELNKLSFGYRWVTRFIALDDVEAKSALKKYQKRWYSQRKGLMSLVTEMAGEEGSDLVNSEAVERAQDADAALQVQANDYAAFGYYTATITVSAKTRGEAEDRIAEVERVINGRGFTTVRETMHSLQAWLGSLPGNVYWNVRRPLIHTLNLVHMLPASAVWSGPRENDHLGGAPHVTAVTDEATPFRLNLNVGDVGHTLVLGPTGSGKSTLLSFLALQWLRYDGAQVVFFDKGASSRAATLGVGGDFYELDVGGSNLAFQPLRDVDDEEERAWAVDWLGEILAGEGVEISAEIRSALWEALGEQGVAGQPKNQRTMYALRSYVQRPEIREALRHYCQGGQYGALFDNDVEEWSSGGSWVAFEMEELMEVEAAVPSVLSYLFHRLETEAFDGRPTLLVLDEAWLFLDNPIFEAKIREWLKVLRKKRVYVVFATQSLADAMESAIAPVLLESCLTRIFLPNSRAMEPEQAGYYKRLGLNRRQVEILSNAIPKREYYYQSQKGRRLFELELGPVALAFTGASDPDDHREMDRVLRDFGEEEFAKVWLAQRGPSWAVDVVAGNDGEAFGGELDKTVLDDPMERMWEEL